MSVIEVFLPYKLVTSSDIIYRNTLSNAEDNFFDAILTADVENTGSTGKYAFTDFSIMLKKIETSGDPATASFNTSNIKTLVTYLNNSTNYETSGHHIRNPITLRANSGLTAADASTFTGYFNKIYMKNSDSATNTAVEYKNGAAAGTTADTTDSIAAEWTSIPANTSFEIVRNNAILKTIAGNYSAADFAFDHLATAAATSDYFVGTELNVIAGNIQTCLTSLDAAAGCFIVQQVMIKLNETQLYNVAKVLLASVSTSTAVDILRVFAQCGITIKVSLHVKEKLNLSGMLNTQQFSTSSSTIPGEISKELVNFVNTPVVKGNLNPIALTAKSDVDYTDIKVSYTLKAVEGVSTILPSPTSVLSDPVSA